MFESGLKVNRGSYIYTLNRCYPLPATRCQLPEARIPLPATRVQLPVANYPRPATRCQLPEASYPRPATRCQLPKASYPRPTTQGKVRQGGLYLEIKASIMPPKKSPKKNASGSKTKLYRVLPESAEVSRMPPKSKKCLCSICEKEVVDKDDQRKGQDAIFCEGNCQEWLHRVCTGLPKKVFLEVYKESDVTLYCPYCTYQRQ